MAHASKQSSPSTIVERFARNERVDLLLRRPRDPKLNGNSPFLVTHDFLSGKSFAGGAVSCKATPSAGDSRTLRFHPLSWEPVGRNERSDVPADTPLWMIAAPAVRIALCRNFAELISAYKPFIRRPKRAQRCSSGILAHARYQKNGGPRGCP